MAESVAGLRWYLIVLEDSTYYLELVIELPDGTAHLDVLPEQLDEVLGMMDKAEEEGLTPCTHESFEREILERHK